MDEQYFLVLLAHISSSDTLVARLATGGAVDRALDRSPALFDRIVRSLEADEEGAIVIRPEAERVHRVIQKIGLGLFVLRYGRVPRLSTIWPVAAYPYDGRDDRPLPLFISTFTERFHAKPWKHVQEGIFSHIIVRDPVRSGRAWCVMDFHQSLWGVVHFPNPRNRKVREDQQLWLF